MTINTNEDFRSQFNSDWANKLIIGVDEVLLDKKEDSERIKNLSTAKTYKTEAKGQDRVEVEFIGKFVLCSNNEDNFIIIDPLETRYWVRKINSFESENENLLEELTKEIPQFLSLLAAREMSTACKTRMWFSASEIHTPALNKIKKRYANKVETELFEILCEIMEAKELEELCFTNSNAKSYLEKSKIISGRTELREILEGKWSLSQEKNSLSYKQYYFDNSGFLMELNNVGRYYKFKIEDKARINDELMK